jgi:hypothetical protein
MLLLAVIAAVAQLQGGVDAQMTFSDGWGAKVGCYKFLQL